MSDTALLELTTQSQQWTFDGIAEPPVPSLLRDFSAPVIVEYDWTDAELALLSAHDANPSRAGKPAGNWPRARSWRWPRRGRPHAACRPAFIDAWRALLTDPAIDAAFRARALALPSEKRWPNAWPPSIPGAVGGRDFLRAEPPAGRIRAAFEANQTPGEYSPRPNPPASER